MPLYTISLGDARFPASGRLLASGQMVWTQKELAHVLVQLSDTLTAITAEVKKVDKTLKFFHREAEGRAGEQLEGKLTVEESLRTDMRVMLTTNTKGDGGTARVPTLTGSPGSRDCCGSSFPILTTIPPPDS